MHMNKIIQFDWSAVFESYWYKKLVLNRAAFYSLQVYSRGFLSVYRPYYILQIFQDVLL